MEKEKKEFVVILTIGMIAIVTSLFVNHVILGL